jgi:hypothetical protein
LTGRAPSHSVSTSPDRSGASLAKEPVREEVLNVLLADLLENRGLISLPESIRRSLAAGGGRRLPDVSVTFADLAGVRIILEGRIGDTAPIKAGLFKKAKGRVEEGLSPIALAVLYSPELRRGASLKEIDEALVSALRLRADLAPLRELLSVDLLLKPTPKGAGGEQEFVEDEDAIDDEDEPSSAETPRRKR